MSVDFIWKWEKQNVRHRSRCNLFSQIKLVNIYIANSFLWILQIAGAASNYRTCIQEAEETTSEPSGPGSTSPRKRLVSRSVTEF